MKTADHFKENHCRVNSAIFETLAPLEAGIRSEGSLRISLTKLSAKREKEAIEIINSHHGKRFVYNTYKKLSPVMAQKYIEFVSRMKWATYIRWDNIKNEFTSG